MEIKYQNTISPPTYAIKPTNQPTNHLLNCSI